MDAPRARPTPATATAKRSRKTYRPWKHGGATLGHVRGEVYWIDRTIGGVRYRLTTHCKTPEAAWEEYRRFEADPIHYAPRGAIREGSEWRDAVLAFLEFKRDVEGRSDPSAGAVLAQEIGHYKARHIHKRLALGIASMALTFFVLSLLLEWPALFTAFGFAEPNRHAALALFSLAGGAFTFFLDPLWSWLSRRHEFEADRYSTKLVGSSAPLRSSLVRLNGENLSNLNPHPWYSAWHYSHPPLVERLQALAAGPGA